MWKRRKAIESKRKIFSRLKTCLISIFLLLFFCSFTLKSFAQDDHGSSCSTATTVSANSTTSGKISYINDGDYFKVDISSPGTLTAYTTFTSDSTDTYGSLRNIFCNTITNDNNGGDGVNFRIIHTVTSASTYYIGVRHSNTNFGTGSYTLHVEFSSSSNSDPVADAGGPYNGIVGKPIIFDGSGSSGPDGDTLTYRWDFGDGSSSSDLSPTHTYASSGNYTATLYVDDNNGGSDSDSTTANIVVRNTDPVSDAGGPYNGVVGKPVILDGSGSSDPDGDTLTYSWDFGDGSSGSGLSPTHTYANPSTYTVILTVDDGNGDTDTDSTTAEVIVNDPDCTYSVSLASKSFTSDGGTSSVSVTVADGCDWTALSNAFWITITSGGSESGNGTVNYSVSSNTSTGSRIGTMTIAGKTFTVTQTGSETNPLPDIKANGSDASVTLGTSETLSVSVSLAAGSGLGVGCDWWVAKNVSGTSTIDGWYYFDASKMSWAYAGDSYTDLSFTYQGPLFDLSTFEVLNMSGLPTGMYTLYFAVDTNMDDSLSMDQIYYDSVVVNITP